MIINLDMGEVKHPCLVDQSIMKILISNMFLIIDVLDDLSIIFGSIKIVIDKHLALHSYLYLT